MTLEVLLCVLVAFVFGYALGFSRAASAWRKAQVAGLARSITPPTDARASVALTVNSFGQMVPGSQRFVGESDAAYLRRKGRDR